VAAAQARRGRHGALHEPERVLHGTREGTSQCQPRRDGGRQGAPRAVRRGGIETRPGKPLDTVRGNQKIHRCVPIEVASFDERSAGAEAQQRPTRVLHRAGRTDDVPDENGGLVEVGGDQGGEGDEEACHESLRLGSEEPISGRRYHDRIEHVVGEAMTGEGLRHRFDDRSSAEHTGFHGRGGQVFGQGIELAGHEGGSHRFPGAHAQGVLGRHGADDAGTEDAELVKGLEIGLDPRAAARVRAGDGQRDLHGWRLAARAGAAMLQAPTRSETAIPGNLQSTVRDLQRRKARNRRQLALVEGIRLVEEALAAGLTFRGALVSPELDRTSRGAALRLDLERHAVSVEEIAARTFATLAATDAPQGVIGIVEPRVWTPDGIPLDRGHAVLVLDAVQDPGNVGTLIRTAHALGAVATVALRGTADPLNPKALRAAMGATFRHPVVTMDDAAFIAWARRTELTLWAAALDGEALPRVLAGADAGGPVAVIVGNEGGGIRPALNAVAARRVAIPLAAGAESLNVAVAAGILLYELERGR
jgi:RNA methyltransferase, TrmH family